MPYFRRDGTPESAIKGRPVGGVSIVGVQRRLRFCVYNHVRVRSAVPQCHSCALALRTQEGRACELDVPGGRQVAVWSLASA